jgi:Peptidase A4 family
MTPVAADALHRFQTYSAPPPGFDPHTAAPKLLRQYGFPRRPDPQKEPEYTKLWQRVLGRVRQLQLTRAELEIDPVMSARKLPTKLATPDFSPAGWGGVVVPLSSLGLTPPANTVFAEWVVPTIFPVPGDPSIPLTVGFWVGLDGSDPDSYELLQAGTAATITGDSVSYWAWTEWYTGKYKTSAVKVSNFAIQPGDRVSFLVCAPEANQGFVSMMNYRTQFATSVGVPAPGSDITSVGQRAEWIVEGISADLPDFGDVVFTNITAGTQSQSFNLSPAGQITNITGNGGADLTAAFIASPTSSLVLWEGSS